MSGRGVRIGPATRTLQLDQGSFNLMGYPSPLSSTGSSGATLALAQGAFAMSGQPASLGSGGVGRNFNPGEYVISNTYYGSTSTSGQAQAKVDMNQVVSTGIFSGLKGFGITLFWPQVEHGSTNSLAPNYDWTGLDTLLTYLWSVWPAARVVIFIMGNTYGVLPSQGALTSANYGQAAGTYLPTYITNCGGSLSVPNAFGSGTHTTYEVQPDYPGGPNYGANMGNFFPTPQQFSPQWYNVGVMQAFLNCWQALSQHVLSGNQYAGLTVAQCPALEIIHLNDENSNGFGVGSAYNYPSGTGDNINPPTSTSDGLNPATVAQFMKLRWAFYTALTGFFPKTLIGACDSWGSTYSNTTDSATNMAANINQFLPAGNRTAPYALSTVQGVGMDCADTRGWDFNTTVGDNSLQSGCAGFIGDPVPNYPNWVVPTMTSLTDYMPEFGQVQFNDYSQANTFTHNQQAVIQVSGGMNNAYRNISHGLWWITDSSFNPNAWPGYIAPALQTAGVLNVRAAVGRPSNLP